MYVCIQHGNVSKTLRVVTCMLCSNINNAVSYQDSINRLQGSITKYPRITKITAKLEIWREVREPDRYC